MKTLALLFLSNILITVSILASPLSDWIASQDTRVTSTLCDRLAAVTTTSNVVVTVNVPASASAATNYAAAWDWFNTANSYGVSAGGVGSTYIMQRWQQSSTNIANGVALDWQRLQDISDKIDVAAATNWNGATYGYPQTNAVPISWQWRDLGLPQMPTGAEVEAAQR